MIHDTSLAEHFSIRRTLNLVRHNYYFSSMWMFIKRYVKLCEFCMRVKFIHKKSEKLLNSLPLLKELWRSVATDYIVKLSVSKVENESFDSI
jgi:hypothetical protein